MSRGVYSSWTGLDEVVKKRDRRSPRRAAACWRVVSSQRSNACRSSSNCWRSNMPLSGGRGRDYPAALVESLKEGRGIIARRFPGLALFRSKQVAGPAFPASPSDPSPRTAGASMEDRGGEGVGVGRTYGCVRGLLVRRRRVALRILERIALRRASHPGGGILERIAVGAGPAAQR